MALKMAFILGWNLASVCGFDQKTLYQDVGLGKVYPAVSGCVLQNSTNSLNQISIRSTSITFSIIKHPRCLNNSETCCGSLLSLMSIKSHFGTYEGPILAISVNSLFISTNNLFQLAVTCLTFSDLINRCLIPVNRKSKSGGVSSFDNLEGDIVSDIDNLLYSIPGRNR